MNEELKKIHELFPKVEHKKENVLTDYIEMTKRSWTYNRLFENEKKDIIELLSNCITKKALKGSYNQRWNILCAIYRAYLIGVGYNDFRWREKKEN